MRNLVEARRDVTFEHPLIGAGGQVVDLGDGVLGSALRAEAVTNRLEVRFENGLEDQFQGSLHDPVPGGGDPEAPQFS